MNKRLVRSFSLRQKYTEELDEKAFQLLRSGRSKTETIAALDIYQQTFYDWMQVHPSFGEAVKLGCLKGEAWWLEQAANRTFDKDFKDSAFKALMQRQYNHNVKDRMIRVDLLASTAVESFKKIMIAVSSAEISTKEALELSQVLLASVSAKEKEELEQRIVELEELAANQ